jgi:hypothetical protein
MSKRLQVLIPDAEMSDMQRLSRGEGMGGGMGSPRATRETGGRGGA